MKKIIIFLMTLILVSCKEPENIEKNNFVIIDDLKNIPQDISNLGINFETPANTTLSNQKINNDFYYIWQFSDYTKLSEFHKNRIGKFANSFNSALIKRPDSEFQHDVKNSNLDKIGELDQKAIITSHTDLRTLPSKQHYFGDPSQAGEGYPFDNLQEDHLYLGTPVKLSHYSEDKGWAFVISNYGDSGWVDSRHISILNDEQVEYMQNVTLGPVIKDNIPIYINGNFYAYSKIGMLLPIVNVSENELTFLVPFKKEDNMTELKLSIISKEYASDTFLKFTEDNVKKIANEFIATPYGWGTYLGNRDCSGFVKNFFSNFGLILPRNSKDQKEFLPNIDISNMTSLEKKEYIIKNAKPYLTLIYFPGHIAIYAGIHNNEPVIQHPIWAMKIMKNNIATRNIIGKNIISRLDYGKELPGYKEKDTGFLYRATHLINIPL